MTAEPDHEVDIEKVVRLKALADQCFGPVVVVTRTRRLSFVDRISAFHEAQKLMATERVLSYVLLEYLNASINASKLPVTLADGTVFDDDGAAINYIGESEPPVERETEILELIQFKQKDARLYQYGVCIFRGSKAPRNFAEARQFWLKGAEAGKVEAQFISGDIAFAEKDYDEAVKWLEQAAGKGHTDAIFAFGLCYLDGLGVTKDLEKAAGCARLAAEQGHAHAQYTIGMAAKDAPERVEWLAKSAAQGFAPARKALEEMN
jgi:TPR repeat protein